MSSDFVKPLIFIIAIALTTVGGILYVERGGSENQIINSYIPTLPGTSDVLPLHNAMTGDDRLREAMIDLGSRNVMQLFADYSTTDYLVSTILLRWTGSHLIDSSIRGPLVDGRIVDFLEKTGYVGTMPLKITTPEMAKDVRTSWYQAFQLYKAKLLLQTAARDVYLGPVGYSPQTDSLYVRGTLSTSFMNELIEVMSYSENPKGVYSNFLVFVRFTKGLDALTPEEKEFLRRMRNVAEGRERIQGRF